MDNTEKARRLLIKHLHIHGGDSIGITDGNVYRAVIDAIDEALCARHVSGAVDLLKFLKEEQQKQYADAKDYMTANQHQYYEEGCDAVLQLIEMRFGG